MVSRFVDVRTTGLKFSNNGQRRAKKMSNLKATKSLDNFALKCDKQVVAGTIGQLRINFTCISKFSKLPSSLRDSGNFVKTLKIRVKLILNCPRAHAITYTNIILPYQ